MTLMQSPETIMLIHRTMVSEQLERRRPVGITARSSVITTIRSVVGEALIALGQRLDPAARRDRPQPTAGGFALAGGRD